MKKFIFAISFIYIIVPASLSAQSGLFGSCTQDRVIKFIDAGLTKSEIVQFCALPEKKTPTASNQPVNKTTQRAQKKLRGNLAVLNGVWTMDIVCDPYAAVSDNIIVNNGNISGALDDGQAIKGSISKDGTIEAYGTSAQAFGEMNGRFTDWKSGTGSGTVTVGGEADCEGTWLMKRK